MRHVRFTKVGYLQHGRLEIPEVFILYMEIVGLSNESLDIAKLAIKLYGAR